MTAWSDKAVTAALQVWFGTPGEMEWGSWRFDRMRRAIEAAQEEMVGEEMVTAIERLSTDGLPTFTQINSGKGDGGLSPLPEERWYLILLSERQRKVLQAMDLNSSFLNEEYAYYTDTIADWAALPRQATRLAIRALVRKGLAELVRGLMSEDDGHLMGSGYRLTDAGRQYAGELLKVDVEADHGA